MPTIVPLIPEAGWLPALVGLVDWELPLVPTLVLAPHPDDETLGAGGLIARLSRAGVPVTIVAITDGEHAYADTPNLADIRIAEQTEALHCLGVPERMIHRLHLPDRDVSGYEDHLEEMLLPLVTADTHLVAPWRRDFILITRERGARRRALLNGRTYPSPTIFFGPGTGASRACLTDLGHEASTQ